MEITQETVVLINARLQDLKFEIALVNQLEQLKEERGYASADATLQEHLAMLSNKFGEKLTSFDEVREALTSFEKELEVLVQTDYLTKKFASFVDISGAMGEVKGKLLGKTLSILDIDESEVEG